MTPLSRRLFGEDHQLARRKIEWAIFAIGGFVIALFHLMLYLSVGALWRDEVSSARLATASSWAEMYGGLINDSFPPLWVTILRLWHLLGLGAGDDWLRFLGVVLSLVVIGVLCWNARMTTSRVPLLALALIAFNPAVFYWGDSVRAYSLALLFVIPLFGCVWKIIEKPTVPRVIAAVMLAVASAQSNYQNSYLILGICAGGAVVCLSHRLWRRAFLILGIGFVSGLSLLPLLPYLSRQGELSRVVRVPLFRSGFFTQLPAAFGSGRPALLAIWGALAILVLCAPLYWRFRRASEDSTRFHASLFAAVSLLVSGLCMAAFVHVVGMPALAWHFIPFLGLAAICGEMVLSQFSTSRSFSLGRNVCAVAAVALCINPLLEASQTRRTNMDLIAAQISQSAEPGDYVLVNPFYSGLSFEWQYKGAAPWSTLPVLPPNDAHAIDFFQRGMALSDPLQRTKTTIESTLKNGKRVWFAGALLFPPAGQEPPNLPPAPQSPYGWASSPYVHIWTLQTAHYLRTHADRLSGFQLSGDQRINGYERYSLYVMEGWKPETDLAANTSTTGQP